MSEYDLIIRAGTVVDGSGGAPFTADVAIRDGLIAEVGAVSGTAAREIDADGAIVAPGFVDIHTHYDGQVTWDERLQPSSWHGVTTVVMGNCGVGFAPALPHDRDRLIELMEGVEDIPGIALSEGLPWNWETFGEYLDSLDGKARDLDFATQVPHAAVRVRAMGDRALAHEQATAAEIAEMAEITAEAIRAGALGFTTSRTLNHKSINGELITSYGAGRDELVAIAEAIGETGTGVLQMVTDFDDVDVDMDLMAAMTGASRRPMSVSVVHSVNRPDRHHEIMAGFDRLRAAGHDVQGQVSARGIGLILGHELTLNPFRHNPSYLKIADLPLPERVAAMRTREVREAILADGVVTDVPVLGARFLNMFNEMFELADPPNYEPDPSENIIARAAALGVTPEELAYDIMLADEGHGMLYLTFANYVDGSLDGLKELLEHPAIIPGLSDGGAHVGTICDGSFPTTLLQHWVRDRERGRLPLEYIVRAQARRTAEAVGLFDRGLLKPGYRADVNVIDLDGMHLHRPEVHHDLPAGGRRLLQRADGYRHTIVAGQETYRDGEPTGALPGRLVRGAKPNPAA
ncbi:N-acyl-D-amino-acid deacylase family protein [Enemella sp. A6]|uniref:N-acyl-D-amino-acid deacylase family protein n=1 Tax=Enemella sp. A6 TaxID=3440152 RepID=UPI003EBA5777